MNFRKTFATSVVGALVLALLCWLLLRGGSGDLALDGNRGKAAAGKSGASHSLRWSGGSGPAGAPEPVGTQGRTIASLRGRVLDALDGKPVPLAIVALRARGGDVLDETATDDDGSFAFAGIAHVVHVVSVQAIRSPREAASSPRRRRREVAWSRRA